MVTSLEWLVRADTASLLSLETRSQDGTGNNVGSPGFGAAGTQFIRVSPASYDFNAGDYDTEAPRTNYRGMSNDIIQEDVTILNTFGVADIFTFFGQFVDHDIDIALEGSEDGPFIVAPVDMDDPNFSGVTLGIHRSSPIDGTGVGPGNPTQHANAITSFVDASNVYGSSDAVLASLRDAGSPWLMATSNGGELPPIGAGPGAQFQAGDIRAGENSALTSMHTIWLKEHNFQAERLKALHPDWTDDEVFFAAKAIVEAEIQNVTFNEWLPLLLGAENIPAYGGYDPGVDATISHEFATAAFRFGHSLISSTIARSDEAGASTGDLALAQAFFNAGVLLGTGSVDTLVRGIASTSAQELDHHVVEDLRSLLFPGPDGLQVRDLSVLNNLRGLDHGLGTLNEVRIALGLTPYASYAELTSDAALATLLETHYGVGGVGEVDLWIGGLIEAAVPGSQLGETFHTIVLDQFMRLRDGDRFYFEERLKDSPLLLREIRETSFSDVIKRVTGIEHLQDDVFIAHDRIGGTALNDDLAGDGGHDLIIGFDGADMLQGGGGDDDLYGDDGADVLDGGDGNDVLDGGRDADTLTGGAGDDELIGGHGADIVMGGAGDDYAYGGSGPDQIFGGAGDDTLLGGGSGDMLHGGTSHDTLVGHSGDDLLFGGAGNDVLLGGPGNDHLIGAMHDDVLDGGGGDDILSGNAGRDTLLGGDQDDDLHGGLSHDILDGQAGSDTLFGGAGNDNLSGGAGDDVLSGGVHVDVLDGGAGDDILAGNHGSDTLIGGAGGDRQSGGAGDDIFRFDALAELAGDQITDLAAGDEIDLSAIEANDGINLTFVGSSAFSGAIGEVRYVKSGGATSVEIDSDGNAIADNSFSIENGEFDLEETSPDSLILRIAGGGGGAAAGEVQRVTREMMQSRDDIAGASEAIGPALIGDSSAEWLL